MGAALDATRINPTYPDPPRPPSELAPNVPLVIQPVTPMHGVLAPSAELVCELAESAQERGLDVRVLPQIHRILELP